MTRYVIYRHLSYPVMINKTSDMTIVSVKKEINPVEYLLNVVLPSSEYVQFYDAKSDMLKVSHHNSSLRCSDD